MRRPATARVDDLVRRGRRQGFLLLPELRNAFEQANVTPAEARSILRELSDAGVQLGNEASEPAGLRLRSPPGPSPISTASEVESADVIHGLSPASGRPP